MRIEDLKLFAEMGRALWASPVDSERIAVETLTAVSLLDLNDDRGVDRAAAALLERVTRTGMAANTRENLKVPEGAALPFYRLFPEERFVLVALHAGRWSYARLGRILGQTSEQVQELAWSARVHLAASGAKSVYPAGAGSQGTHCPEYDSRVPWTQRFLDEEIATASELMFLRNHLMACDSCRQALHRSREVYYAVDAQIPRPSDTERAVEALRFAARSGARAKLPSERTFGESLAIFASRPDVWIALALFFGLVLWKVLAAFTRLV